jgi:hypothetical protein
VQRLFFILCEQEISKVSKRLSLLQKAKAHLSGVAWAANRFARQPRDILFPAIRVHYLLIN